MNYLAGPLTRVQIPALNKLVGALTGAAKSTSPANLDYARAATAQGGAASAPAVSTPVNTPVIQWIHQYTSLRSKRHR